MMERDGHIINVSSESVDMPYPHLSVYQSSKAGLERFSNCLYRELDASGIRVSNVRAGSMFEEGKSWDVNPDDAMQFYQAALAAGINLGEKPLSQFTSVTGIFRALIDLPADLHAVTVGLHARKVQ
jgi:short-subunit dehydrogenase